MNSILGLSFRTVENPHFISMCDLLWSSNATFKIPSRRKLKNLVKKAADSKRDQIEKTLQNVDQIAITTDGWTSTKQNISYIGVTVHYYIGFTLHSLSLGVKRLNGKINS